MTERDPSFERDPIQAVAAVVEDRIIDLDSPHARALHVRHVVEEIDEGDSIPLWMTPEQRLRRDDVDHIGDHLMKSIVSTWFARQPSMHRGSSTPSVDRLTNGLIGKSQGSFVHPHLSRLAVPDQTLEEYMAKNPKADPHSFRQHELSIEVFRGSRTVYSALGLLSFKNTKMVGGRRSPRVDICIVPAVGGNELRAEVLASIERATASESQALQNPHSAGLPGTGRRKMRQ